LDPWAMDWLGGVTEMETNCGVGALLEPQPGLHTKASRPKGTAASTDRVRIPTCGFIGWQIFKSG
jgi:hypothetical protein